jgi:oligopeptide transport system substrate-binding protein
VDVKVRQLEPETFLYHLKEEADEMYSIGWVADYPHPQDFLDILFRSGMDSNFGGYSSPEIDALLEEAGTDTDYQRSLATYQRIERMLVEDAACLPLWFGQNYMLVRPYVSGYRLDGQGFARLTGVSVADR